MIELALNFDDVPETLMQHVESMDISPSDEALFEEFAGILHSDNGLIYAPFNSSTRIDNLDTWMELNVPEVSPELKPVLESVLGLHRVINFTSTHSPELYSYSTEELDLLNRSTAGIIFLTKNFKDKPELISLGLYAVYENIENSPNSERVFNTKPGENFILSLQDYVFDHLEVDWLFDHQQTIG